MALANQFGGTSFSNIGALFKDGVNGKPSTVDKP
jgi:hypothetical protein